MQQLIQYGFISRSLSSWASPTFVVPKKTGDWRIVFDYRKLNSVTKQIKYPIPNISLQWHKFRNKKYISTIDIKSGYWHIPVRKSDRKYLAFLFDGVLYEWNVMPFGPTNAPSYFQYTMQTFQSFRFCYIFNDITIVSETLEEHKKHLKEVFKILNHYKLN